MVLLKRFGLLSILFFANQLLALSNSTVTKLFYHQGRCEDKLVFYFDYMPKITRKKTDLQQTYLLQNINLSQEAQQALAAITSLNSDYAMHFDLKPKKTGQDWQVQINFEPGAIDYIYAAKFKPISQPAGLAIKILHRKYSCKKSKSACHANRRTCNERAFKNSQIKKEIVLDFGHGGTDLGATCGQIYEKDVVRQVGLKLANLLNKHGYLVHLTRKSDEFVPLDERTRFANLHTKSQLFVSLHANHAPNKKIKGLETYYMHYNLLEHIDGGQIVNRDQLNVHSAQLAQLVHGNILKTINNYDLVDRKVKQSVSQVLLGVEMPAILVELGFLSNLQEAKQLDTPEYQLLLAHGILNGINAYFAS